MILYTSQTTSRLKYIVDFVFGEVMGIQCEITNSIEAFKSSSLLKINYSNQQIEISDLWILPSELLFETNVVEQNLIFDQWHDLPCFFITRGGDLPFDLLAASFYLVSRYEEYLPYTPDLYQRFPVEKSIAFTNHFLSKPLVDLWCKEFKQLILSKYPAVRFEKRIMQFIPTYDIDIAYSYAGKGLKRNMGGAMRDLLAGKFSQVLDRIQVLFADKKDPFDSFELLDEIHASYSLQPIYFFLMSKGGPLDKNISPSHPLMQQLIQRISKKYLLGIHPSFQSHDDVHTLKQEISLLPTTKSRQHYIRFHLPITYRNLLEAGITEDYSMGYGSMNGFRASTSFAHPWFDLEKNECTTLKLFPFCWMECNSYFEQQLNAEEAYHEMIEYANYVRLVGGNLITVWHNFSLGSDPMWKGWKVSYIQFINEVA